jgi:hemoglobin
MSEWSAFERELAAALSVLKDEILIVSTRTGHRFVQFNASPDEGVFSETVSNGYLAAAEKLTDEQVAALEASCAASATARASRHAQTPLFKRLGGEPGIHAITREVVSLHLKNPEIRRYFEGLDPDAVAKHVAQFLISGTGGPQVYQGPDLTTSHGSMKLTNRDFVSAGGDVVQAMKNLTYGQDEIDEVVCSLVSLRSKVVLAQ